MKWIVTDGLDCTFIPFLLQLTGEAQMAQFESEEDEGESVFSSDRRLTDTVILSSGTPARFASNLVLLLRHLTIMRSIVAALKGCGPFCM